MLGAFGRCADAVAGVGADVRAVDGGGDGLDGRAGLPTSNPDVPILGPGEVAEAADVADELGRRDGADHEPIAVGEALGRAAVNVAGDPGHPDALVETVADVADGRRSEVGRAGGDAIEIAVL